METAPQKQLNKTGAENKGPIVLDHLRLARWPHSRAHHWPQMLATSLGPVQPLSSWEGCYVTPDPQKNLLLIDPLSQLLLFLY